MLFCIQHDEKATLVKLLNIEDFNKVIFFFEQVYR